MKKYTQEELNEALRLHKLWLLNDPNGIRLNLNNCNCDGLNMSKANMFGANMSGANNLEESQDNKLVFNTWFDHTDKDGNYDGWTDHNIIITPSLISSFNIKITGRNKNNIKESIHSIFINFDYTVEVKF